MSTEFASNDGPTCGYRRSDAGRRVLLRYGVHAGLLALVRRDRSGSGGERVEAATGLGEGDHVADRLGARQQGHDAVPAERQATVRRGAVLEGVQQEAELLLGLDLVEAHDREHPLLHVLAVDTDRAAADLV